MASMVLYPPILESSYPAFVATEDAVCRIYFSLSKFNASSDFKCAHIAIAKQGSGLNVVNKADDEINGVYRSAGIILNVDPIKVSNEENLYYVEIKNEDLANGWQIGWIYKIQLRLSSVYFTNDDLGQTAWLNANGNNFSEWSTIATIKAIGPVSFSIANYKYNSTIDTYEATIEELDFVGEYQNVDSSENLYSYRIKLFDEFNNLLEDSGILYSNKYYNINQISYSFKTEPENQKTYLVNLSYETINQYVNYITFTLTIERAEEDSTNIILLSAENDKNNIMLNLSTVSQEEEEGRIGLKLYSDSTAETLDVMIRRADSRDNFQTWTDIKHLTFNGENVNNYPIVYDYTAESGVWYKYGIQKYVKTGNSVSRGPLNIVTNPIMRDYNYTFLLGENNQQLKLQFNNNLNNYKVNLNEAKSITLGGQYPFIIRNGATNYKTFSLSGIISFNMDENGLFFTKEQAYKFEEIAKLYANYNTVHGISHYDYIFEHEFREEVIKFLHSDKPKLLKSPTEGNILVRLMDINLTPNQQLSRIIYEFSSNANEIAAPTMENYYKYNLYNL